MPTTYTGEFALSGRSSCKFCKEKILEGEMRIRTSAQSEGDDKVFESSRHVKCQSLPQVNKKANQSMTDWVDSDAFTCAPHVEKKSQNVLKTASEVYDLIVAGLNEPRYKKPKVDKATASVAEGGSPTKIKQMKQMMEDKKRKVEDLDSEIEDVTPSKKTKLEFGGSSPSEEEFAQYTKYSAMKVDQLKDFLRWNGQKLDTKKDSLVAMVIDQAMHGRLGRCTQCEGKLNLVLETCDGSHFCKGSYSEEMSCFVACGIKYPPKTAPRFKFFDKKPTDEEMETIEKENKSMSASNITASSNAKIKTEVSFSDLDLATNEGKKEAATLMLTACRSIRVKLPADDSEAKPLVGRIILQNPGESPTALLKMLATDYGVEASAEEAKAKTAAMAGTCLNPANGPLLAVISELSSLYFKEGNGNAGGSYQKAAAAIAGLEVEVTADNAASMGKPGKNKVQNIGKGTADKMKEFITTGKIEKLEEKRAANLA